MNVLDVKCLMLSYPIRQEVGIRDTLGGLILAGFLTVQVAGDMVARVVAVSSEEQEFKNHHVSVGLGHCVLLVFFNFMMYTDLGRFHEHWSFNILDDMSMYTHAI